MVENQYTKVKKELDFNSVVFRQLDRIMRSMSMNDQNLELTIEALDCLLACYEDSEYSTEIQDLIESLKDAKRNLAKKKGIPLNNLSSEDISNIEFFMIKEKLKMLMKLALRNKLIPQKEEVYHEED